MTEGRLLVVSLEVTINSQNKYSISYDLSRVKVAAAQEEERVVQELHLVCMSKSLWDKMQTAKLGDRTIDGRAESSLESAVSLLMSS